MTSARTRERLIERLKAEGVKNPAVLERMRAVPRHLFVDEALASRAYEDTALPIGFGQTISQPYIVAAMTEALIEGRQEAHARARDRHGLRLPDRRARAVRAAHLQRRAHRRCCSKRAYDARGAQITNVSLRHADGWHGWRSQAPFQGILVAAAPEIVPPELFEQLDEGGRLVIPIGARGQQMLLRVTRNGDEFKRERAVAGQLRAVRRGHGDVSARRGRRERAVPAVSLCGSCAAVLAACTSTTTSLPVSRREARAAVHVVQRGETLTKIAWQHRVDQQRARALERHRAIPTRCAWVSGCGSCRRAATSLPPPAPA